LNSAAAGPQSSNEVSGATAVFAKLALWALFVRLAVPLRIAAPRTRYGPLQDVPRGVDVAMNLRLTMRTTVDADTQVLWDQRTAFGARLRRASRIDLNEPAPALSASASYSRSTNLPPRYPWQLGLVVLQVGIQSKASLYEALAPGRTLRMALYAEARQPA
jgi:hypothetical protein